MNRNVRQRRTTQPVCVQLRTKGITLHSSLWERERERETVRERKRTVRLPIFVLTKMVLRYYILYTLNFG